jgi:hypothetical protein
MRHHLEATRTYGIYNLMPLFQVRDFELLLQKNRGLLIRRLDNTCYENMIRRRRGGVKERQEVDGLRERRNTFAHVSRYVLRMKEICRASWECAPADA